jgi:hypothetical protein
MHPNKSDLLDLDIDLTTQELLAPFAEDDVLEIHDAIAIAAICESDAAANAEARSSDALDETSEIELTAEQMDAMLEGRWP